MTRAKTTLPVWAGCLCAGLVLGFIAVPAMADSSCTGPCAMADEYNRTSRDAFRAQIEESNRPRPSINRDGYGLPGGPVDTPPIYVPYQGSMMPGITPYGTSRY